MNCPSCSTPLSTSSASSGMLGTCGSCHGALLAQSALRLHLSAATIAELWVRAEAGPASTRACSACNAAFRVWTEPARPETLELDVRIPCELLWFDAGEIDKLRAFKRAGDVNVSRSRPGSDGDLMPSALEGLGMLAEALLMGLDF